MNFDQLKHDLNLCAIGIAPAHDLGDEYTRLLDWMSHGYHGNMAWLAKSARKRCDPAHVMAEPKSVIVCAMRYEDMPRRSPPLTGGDEGEGASSPPPSPPPRHTAGGQASRGRGQVKYLLHEDYHIIMMQKLEAVASALKAEYPDMRYKCYVDTGPVLEKAWGVRAGLGFIGKNTLLISPEHGSQMALGVVVTNIPLLCKEGLTLPLRRGGNSCNSCTACLDACPTKALVAPYILDARKCISYKFFIEKQQGGCDICQNVCLFNKENAHA